MNFKQWLYNEAFELPFDTIKDIYEYYLDGYKQYLKAPRTKIPVRYFDLDLKGTNYEFLSHLNPRVRVQLVGSIPGYPAYYNNGNIALSFSDFSYITYSAVEHEVLHYLQDLIKWHAHSKIPKGVEGISWRKKRKRKSPTIGGLPRLPLVKRIMKSKGINVDGYVTNKRTKHEHRPIEYYTNLNSLIRSLQYQYIKSKIGFGIAPNSNIPSYALEDLLKNEYLMKSVRDSKEKQAFFNKMVKDRHHVISDLLKVQKLDDELYQIYMKNIYKQFIDNKEFGSDALKIRDIIERGNEAERLKHDDKVRKKLDQNEKQRLKRIQGVGGWTEADFAGRLTIELSDMEDFSNVGEDITNDINYSNSEIAEEMFKELDMELHPDNDNMSVSLGSRSLKKLFDKIKKARTQSLHTGGSIGSGITLPIQVLKCNYDYMAHHLAKLIAFRLQEKAEKEDDEKKTPTQKDILDLFYPGPYEFCFKDENDQITNKEKPQNEL